MYTYNSLKINCKLLVNSVKTRGRTRYIIYARAYAHTREMPEGRTYAKPLSPSPEVSKIAKNR